MDDVSARQSEIRVPIREEPDVAMARKHVREAAMRAGLSQAAREALAIAVSEIARNIVVYAGWGEICIQVVQEADRCGIVVIAADEGPGIADPQQALEDGYSTGDSLGLGLSSAMRLVDEFEIVSEGGKGTTITMRKWSQ